jgi:CheY-like chemotaxis protein
MRARIMVVDDEAVTGRLLLYQLQGLGFEVSYLQDGLQALQRVLIEQPDLILLDVMMPQISGWEVCREIRSCSTVPIIMLTAKDADDDVVAGLSAGADDYVTKPFTMAQLQARIDAVLRRSEHRPRREPVLGAARVYTQIAPGPRADLSHAAARVAEPAPAAVAIATPFIAAPVPVAVAEAGPAPRAVESSEARRSRLGPRLRAERQARGLSLYQAERLCRVRWDYLQALEQENWDYMPRQQIRAVLATYAALLRVDLQDYMGGRRHAVSQRVMALPVTYYQTAAVALAVMLVFIVAYLAIVALRL